MGKKKAQNSEQYISKNFCFKKETNIVIINAIHVFFNLEDNTLKC